MCVFIYVHILYVNRAYFMCTDIMIHFIKTALWLSHDLEVLVASMVMLLPSEHPWVTLSLGSLCEEQEGAASPHPHTLSGILPGTQSYCHCPGNFHTRTRYTCECLRRSKSGPSRYRRGPHHGAENTRYQWVERHEVVVYAAQGQGQKRNIVNLPVQLVNFADIHTYCHIIKQMQFPPQSAQLSGTQDIQPFRILELESLHPNNSRT